MNVVEWFFHEVVVVFLCTLPVYTRQFHLITSIPQLTVV